MKQTFFKIFHAVLLIVSMDVVGTGLWAWATTQTFEKSVPMTELAVVFSSDYIRRSKELSPETYRRLNHAIDLYKKGTIRCILCIGGIGPENNVYDPELMRDFLVDQDFPEENVFLQKKSSDIQTTWRKTRQMIVGHRWRRIVVTGSPFYLHRFRGIIKEEPDRQIAVYYSPYSVKNTDPELKYLDIWKQVHYEGMIYLSQLFPRETYDKLIKKLRKWK